MTANGQPDVTWGATSQGRRGRDRARAGREGVACWSRRGHRDIRKGGRTTEKGRGRLPDLCPEQAGNAGAAEAAGGWRRGARSAFVPGHTAVCSAARTPSPSKWLRKRCWAGAWSSGSVRAGTPHAGVKAVRPHRLGNERR